MIVGIVSEKGGVSKSTTAIHLAAFFSRIGSTLLLDGDRLKCATNWDQRGRAAGNVTPFRVAPVGAAMALAPHYEHKIVDTGQNPNIDDLLVVAKYSDLLVVPSKPAGFDPDGLGQTIRALRSITHDDGSPIQFRVLITRVLHRHRRKVAKIRETLKAGHVPIFETEIPELTAFERAAEQGVLVDSYTADPYSEQAWAAYEAVGKELLNGKA